MTRLMLAGCQIATIGGTRLRRVLESDQVSGNDLERSSRSSAIICISITLEGFSYIFDKFGRCRRSGSLLCSSALTALDSDNNVVL